MSEISEQRKLLNHKQQEYGIMEKSNFKNYYTEHKAFTGEKIERNTNRKKILQVGKR